MNTNSIKNANVERDCQTSECKVISIYESHDKELADEMDEGMGWGFAIDFLDLIYFIPIVIIIAAIYPVIYIAFFWTRAKIQLTKVFNSIFTRNDQ